MSHKCVLCPYYTYSHNCGMTKEPANPKDCPQDKIRRAVKGIRK